MRLALSEIPNHHLKEFSLLSDLDFVLAHRLLEDKVYADFYKEQLQGKHRTIILDNSMHELKHPVTPKELITSAKVLAPHGWDFRLILIPPDKLGETQWNYEQFKATRSLGSQFNVGAVMCGDDELERVKYYDGVRDAYWLFWPYRKPRYSWYRSLIAHRTLAGHVHHLLGVSTFTELEMWDKVAFSVDTCKPIKWAYAGEKFVPDMNLRGSSRDRYDTPMTEKEQTLVYYNTAFLRRFMS